MVSQVCRVHIEESAEQTPRKRALRATKNFEPKPRGYGAASMPTAKCRVKHQKKEMPGAKRRMEEHGGLPELPQAPAAVSPWAPKNFGTGRNSTPEPIEPPARMSPAPGICPHVAKPSAETRATNRGGARASDRDLEAAVAKRSPVNSARHNAHDLSVRLNTFRRQETQHLVANAVYAKKNPKSVPMWFFQKYKIITNS